jgi:putative ABC transport system permease protein
VILLRLISWPYFRKHLLRTALTTAGIVLGVALFVAVRAANSSVVAAFAGTVDRIAGKTELQVTAGDTGFGEEILEKVQSASSVRVAVPVIEAVVDSKIKGQGSVLVMGIDMTGDRSLRDYDLDNGKDDLIDDPLIFLAQPDSLILSKEFADKNGIRVGSHVPLGTAEGTKTFTVRGIVKTSGLASAFGGNIAIMDIYAAQKMFGRGRTFDRIDLARKPGVAIADCEHELETLLGPGFHVQTPSSRGGQFETMIASYSLMVSLSSAFALFIGMFIIYNSFATAVAQRRSEIGILRALGASRGQVRGLFLGESAAIGLVGSIIGVFIGLLIARAAAASIGALIADVYGVAQQAYELTTSPWLIALSLAVGVATSLVAALIPASTAADVDPVRAIQKGRFQLLSAGEHRIRIVLAIVCGLAAAGCLTLSTARAVFYAGYLSLIFAALLVVPILCVALARALRPILRRVLAVEGTLAADSLIQTPRRTSATVAALMLSLALVVAFAGMAQASYDSIVDWMNVSLNPDLFVLPSQNLVTQTTRFPASMGRELASVDGVERVQMVRTGRIMFKDSPVMLVALELASIQQTVNLRPVSGSKEEMYRKSIAGDGLLVSDNLAELHRLKLGDMLDIDAPYGHVRLPIVGVVVDQSDQQGAIIVDRSVFVRYWHDEAVNIFRLYLKPNADHAQVRQRIFDRFDGKRQVFVLTNRELKQYILTIADRWFGLVYLQVAVAVLVAILGIFNTLTVSITDRRRELGVLRAVGGLHNQIRGTIWLEALSVAAIGLVVGGALGAANLYYLLEIVRRDISGLRLDYHFPINTMAALVPIILVTAFVAALWPAEATVRGSLVEALEYE